MNCHHGGVGRNIDDDHPVEVDDDDDDHDVDDDDDGDVIIWGGGYEPADLSPLESGISHPHVYEVRVVCSTTFNNILQQRRQRRSRFFVVESLKELYRGDSHSSTPVPKLVTGAFGVVAGAASVFGNTPLDVIKTRMQVGDIIVAIFINIVAIVVITGMTTAVITIAIKCFHVM